MIVSHNFSSQGCYHASPGGRFRIINRGERLNLTPRVVPRHVCGRLHGSPRRERWNTPLMKSCKQWVRSRVAIGVESPMTNAVASLMVPLIFYHDFSSAALSLTM